MAPISSEDLEHIEDKKLDAAYEEHLERLGDDLRPLPSVRKILDSLFVDSNVDEQVPIDLSNRAVDIAMSMGEDEESTDEALPELPKDPTDEQLIEFAEKHPTIKPLLKLFRGKVVSVKKLK